MKTDRIRIETFSGYNFVKLKFNEIMDNILVLYFITLNTFLQFLLQFLLHILI
jgi:hypothetical protein